MVQCDTQLFFGLLPTGSSRQRGENREGIAGCEEVFKLLAGIQRSSFSAVNIAVHGEREVSMAAMYCRVLGATSASSSMVR